MGIAIGLMLLRNLNMNEKFIAVLACAGMGKRFCSSIPKQYTMIGAKSVLRYTLDVFLSVSKLDKIVIVARSDDNQIDEYNSISSKIVIVKVGGVTRFQSVLNGLNSIKCSNNDWILVHDVARCCVTYELIEHLINELKDDPVGGILAIPATDTLKIVQNGIIQSTLDRNTIYQAQTPQMFRYGLLLNALDHSIESAITDEASSVEKLGLPVRIIEGDARNIKLTYETDLDLARSFLK